MAAHKQHMPDVPHINGVSAHMQHRARYLGDAHGRRQTVKVHAANTKPPQATNTKPPKEANTKPPQVPLQRSEKHTPDSETK